MNNSPYKTISSKCLLLAALFLFVALYTGCKKQPKEYVVREKGYHLTNPLLDFDTIDEFKGLQSVKKKVNSIIKSYQKQNAVCKISVYFRDLNNGPWFGIDERENYIPASLQKVSIMIACLKKAEDDPGLLLKTIKYDAVQKVTKKTIESSKGLIPGKYYTMDELISSMIAKSDNYSAQVLVNTIGFDAVNDVQGSLDLPKMPIGQEEYYISVKKYASFFRILYNASYLNRKMSEKALSYLTQPSYDRGIVQGVPKDITVAHKFGFRVNEKQKTVQFHDCGIVYYPEHPYLLCVMTQGGEMKSLVNVVRDISGAIFAEVDKQYRN